MLRSDEVLSNAVYALSWTPWLSVGGAPAATVASGGVVLAVTSASFHATRERWWQKMDIWGVFSYIGCVAAALAVVYTGQQWIGAVGIIVSAVYLAFRYRINSTCHFVGWLVPLLGALFWMTGWWALLPTGFVLVALGAKVAERLLDSVGTHGWVHSLLWHVPLGVAVMLIPVALQM